MTIAIKHHWLWIAFSEDTALLYGCIVHAAEPWAALSEKDKQTTIKFGRKSFKIIQAMLETIEAKRFVDAIAAQSAIDLSNFGGPSIGLRSSRRRLIDGFGRCSRPAETFVSEKSPEFSDDEWLAALDFLNATLGIDFRRTSDRLCGFDVFDQPELADAGVRVDFKVEREQSNDTKNYPERFSLHYGKATSQPITVGLELELGDDRVFSQIFSLEPGQMKTVQAVPFSHYRMSVFDGDGLLVQFEQGSLFLRAGFNMAQLGSTRVIEDRLAHSAQGLGVALRSQASKVQTRSTSRSLVGVTNVAFDVHQTQMRALIRRLAPPKGNDRWFPRGVVHELGVIAYLNSLLDGARVSAATIVDPWFGVDTLKRVITRLESLDVALTVVTSLGTKNPETNETNPNLLLELQDTLSEFRRDKVPNAAHRLRVVNLVDGLEQAFHDRYLLLSPHEGEKEVYLLSNSLNRMAGKWPFCISKLEPAAALDAARYIDALAAGRDISGSTNSTVNFQWSSHDGR